MVWPIVFLFADSKWKTEEYVRMCDFSCIGLEIGVAFIFSFSGTQRKTEMYLPNDILIITKRGEYYACVDNAI